MTEVGDRVQKESSATNPLKVSLGYVLFFIGLLLSALAFALGIVLLIAITNPSANGGPPIMVTLVVFVATLALTVGTLVVAQKLRHPKSSPYHPSNPVISLGHAWIQKNDELIECSDVQFNSIENAIIYSRGETKESVAFDTIQKVRPVHDVYRPAIQFDMHDGQSIGIYFVQSADDIRVLSSEKTLLKRVVLGEGLTAATMPTTATVSTYRQFHRDVIVIIEQWLKYHKIKAYTLLFNRNIRTFVGIAGGAAVLVIGLIVFLSLQN